MVSLQYNLISWPARTENFPCGALVAEVLAPPPIGPLIFANHFPSWQLSYEHERELQAVIAAQFIEDMIRKSKRQVILVGDFDADPEASSVKRMLLDRAPIFTRPERLLS